MSHRAITNLSAGHGGMPAAPVIRTMTIEKATGVNFTYVPYKRGAGASDAAGVERALDILNSEFKAALGQLGCNAVAWLRGVELQRRHS